MNSSRSSEMVRPSSLRYGRALILWLRTVAFLIFAMVLVGGATRLTESGLSITEWKPLLGAIPPLTEEDWRAAFLAYQQIPEYKAINQGMSLEDFKTIYWWEWAHRLLGRLIGLVFLLPFLFFLLRGAIPRAKLPALISLFCLGGLQGFIGWWMVMSGLSERTDVSQYRLAIHLTLALVIFAATLWIAEDFRNGRAVFFRRHLSFYISMAALFVGLLFLQIFLGGLVAGLNAGFIYNTWPLMEGALIPDGLFFQTPWWINFFENHLTVQFVHRLGAYILLILALFQFLYAWRIRGTSTVWREAGWILLLTIMQAYLGILALVFVVPLSLALLHQAMAVILLAVAVIHLHRLTVCPENEPA